MALTRVAPLSPPVGRYRTARRALVSILLSTLAACAEAPDGDDFSEYEAFDASVAPTDAGQPDARDADPPPVVSNGPDAAPVIEPPPARDAGNEASAPTDASAPPRDGGATTMEAGRPMDASQDTGPVTPPPMDSGSSVPDTGPPPVVDAGADTGPVSPPDAGTTNPNMCMATPSYPTTTACAKCTCTKCGSQVATCYASNDSAKNTQCAAVQACAEKNRCTGRDCYCGNESTLGCALSPTGACKAVIETAANTTSPSEVLNQSTDPNTAVGRANAIGTCQQANCRSECGL